MTKTIGWIFLAVSFIFAFQSGTHADIIWSTTLILGVISLKD